MSFFIALLVTVALILASYGLNRYKASLYDGWFTGRMARGYFMVVTTVQVVSIWVLFFVFATIAFL